MTKDHILSEIRRTSALNQGKPLGRNRFAEETGIKESDWSGRYWTRWNDAIREAGLKPNEMNQPMSLDQVQRAFIELIKELGHFPTVVELKLKSRNDPQFPSPSHNTFNKLGSKSARAQRILAYCKERPDLADVASICAPLAGTAPTDEDVPGPSEVLGFVYLLKSGKFFKIGRSVCAEKRHYEIQLQLPEELKLIHKIKTDDPEGIEAYWHTRFADKRKRGEWFNLNSEDVKTFRRRKFM
jgi:hypothetical protein